MERNGLGNEFQQFMSTYRRYFQKKIGNIGLAPGQPMFLRVIKDFPGLNQRELADECKVTPATLSRSLNTMENNGWIQRQENYDKRRSISFSLTIIGEAKLKQAINCQKEISQNIFGCLSDGELESLKAMLSKLITTADKLYTFEKDKVKKP